MYLVTNLTTRIINIGDLGIVLNKKQMMDLDKVKTLIPPEKSKDLSTSQRSGLVKVKHDRNTVKPDAVKPVVSQDDIIADLRDSMKEEIENQFKKLSLKNGAENSGNADMQQLMQMMQQMMENQQSSGSSKPVADIHDDDLDDDIMSNIHAKAVDKLDQSTEAEINNEKSKIKGDDLLNNADELEGLI